MPIDSLMLCSTFTRHQANCSMSLDSWALRALNMIQNIYHGFSQPMRFYSDSPCIRAPTLDNCVWYVLYLSQAGFSSHVSYWYQRFNLLVIQHPRPYAIVPYWYDNLSSTSARFTFNLVNEQVPYFQFSNYSYSIWFLSVFHAFRSATCR